ncbi:MAG: hypothetical protein GY749_17755 [Desulfobacteraceae bacterium]|nr:hypothetical protein [Desulfobacteraceae bacterium]
MHKLGDGNLPSKFRLGISARSATPCIPTRSMGTRTGGIFSTQLVDTPDTEHRALGMDEFRCLQLSDFLTDN